MNRRFLLPALWAAVIFGTSCTVVTRRQWLTTVHDAAPTMTTPSALDQFWTRYWWVFVKGYHVLEYALLALFCHWATGWRRNRIAIVAFGCLLYAASDEVHQLFVDQRGGRVSDVLIDSGGIAIGTLPAALLARRRGERDRPRSRR
jgi:VanZ family protein